MDINHRKNDASQSDEALIRAVATGDSRAFSTLYDRHAPMLFGLSLKILKDKTLAEDVLQDVFVSVWKKAAQFNAQRGNFGGWITILCRNRCIDAFRSRARLNKRFANWEDDFQNVAGVDRHSDVFDNIDRQKRLKVGLVKLPREQRIVIEMAYFEGYSQSEISDLLDLPLGTVKTRMRLGMNKLRDALAGRGVAAT